MSARRQVVARTAPLSVRGQCRLLEVNRASLYYEPKEPDPETQALMRKMDQAHLEHPFFGTRMMTRSLRQTGERVNRKRVQRLMRLMGLVSVGPRPSTSKRAPEHRVFPYLLRGRKVRCINEVWAADITYAPLERGFAYLVAVIDWFSRRVLA